MLKVVVPFDSSDNALRALSYVAEMRGRYREPIELHVLNVQRPIVSGAVKMFISEEALNQYYQEEGDKALASAQRFLDNEKIPYRRHIIVGDPGPTIVRFTRENGCSMIVMGTRGLGAVSGALLGSVATKVIHLADVPVLLVK